MEDEAGEPISPGIKNSLRGDIFSYWSEIHHSGKVLTNFTELGMTQKSHFCQTFKAMSGILSKFRSFLPISLNLMIY